MDFIRPPKLKVGDTVAILSPSWGGPNLFPAVFEKGLRVIEGLGLKIQEYPSTRETPEFLYRNPKARASDFNLAMADPKISAIIASIGGNDSVRILPFIDQKLFQKNPKVIMGYSDTTTLLTLAFNNRLVTFHGYSVMAGFSQYENLPIECQEHVRKMLLDPKEHYTYTPFNEYCDGYPDWENPNNVGKLNPLKNTSGWHWLQGKDCISGRLFGGCIEVLEFLKGTEFWPKPELFDDAILLFETSEDVPTIDNVTYMLRNYGSQGILDRISGILFGRARDYSNSDKEKLDQAILSVVNTEFGRTDLALISNMDFGHTDPQHIFPMGVNARIDCSAQSISLCEAWLS